MVSIEIDDEMHRKFRRYARERGITVDKLVASVLKEFADKEDAVDNAIHRWRSSSIF